MGRNKPRRLNWSRRINLAMISLTNVESDVYQQQADWSRQSDVFDVIVMNIYQYKEGGKKYKHWCMVIDLYKKKYNKT